MDFNEAPPFSIDVDHNKPILNLGFGLHFEELYTHEGLLKVHGIFHEWLKTQGVFWEEENHLPEYSQYPQRQFSHPHDSSNLSEFYMKFSPYLEAFMCELFPIKDHLKTHENNTKNLDPMWMARRHFIQRIVSKSPWINEASSWDSEVRKNIEANLKEILGHDFHPLGFVKMIGTLEPLHPLYDIAIKFAICVLSYPHDYPMWSQSPLFQRPQPRLIHGEDLPRINHGYIQQDITAKRQGFSCTHTTINQEKTLGETHYCIGCHPQKKDSCRTGLKEKNTPQWAQSPEGVPLQGCPLGQRISEMNVLYRNGHPLAALAVAMVDNPLIPLTGDRICNQCRASCIFQKQSAVDVPAIETSILETILNLPWGVEIYSLLTRWNPLNRHNPLPQKETNRRILVVGQGPSGMALCHYMLQDGHEVLAIDSMNIQPWTIPFEPIEKLCHLYEMSKDMVSQFGGVAQYGITARWDKRRISLIRLILERRQKYHVQGNIRFGGTLTLEDAFNVGCDHVAFCMGAGEPKFIDVPGNGGKGIHLASDVLMNLHLQKPYEGKSLGNLDISLPMVVIGGGLTAIDTATEILAYYPLHVKKFSQKWYSLSVKDQEDIQSNLTPDEQKTMETWLEHHEALKNASDPQKLVRQWGGVTVIYGQPIHKGPAYKLNAEEIHYGLAEGISIKDQIQIISFDLDPHHSVQGIYCKSKSKSIYIQAKSVFLALGTKPQQAFQEEQENLLLNQKDFAPITDHRFFIIDHPKGKVSKIGDMNPHYKGSVVHALASAKEAAPHITEDLKNRNSSKPQKISKITEKFTSRVEKIKKVSPKVYEVCIHSPMAAQKFSQGLIYGLRIPFEHQHNLCWTETIPLTAMKVDGENIFFLIEDRGGSSHMVSLLKKGQKIGLIGPSGTPLTIPPGIKIAFLAGQGINNGLLISIGEKLKKQGTKIIWLALYKNKREVFYQDHMESLASHLLWSFEEENPKGYKKSVLEILNQYNVEWSYVLGNVDFQKYFASLPIISVVGRAQNPMECMTKGLCGRCIQKITHPKTGQEEFIFTCHQNHHEIKNIHWDYLNQRLKVNKLSEKVSRKCS